jgi:hypothetical protein
MKQVLLCRLLILACAGAVMLWPGTRLAQATLIGITDWSSVGSTATDPSGTVYQCVGYDFSTDIDITVTALGKFWYTGMKEDSTTWEARIWDVSQNVVAEVDIPASNPKETVGSHEVIFQDLATPVTLTAGTYRIAVRIWRPDTDIYYDGPLTTPPTLPSTGDHITWIQGKYRTWTTAGDGHIAYPTGSDTLNKPGYFGVDFKYTPEPVTLVLLGLGGLGLYIRRRR